VIVLPADITDEQRTSVTRIKADQAQREAKAIADKAAKKAALVEKYKDCRHRLIVGPAGSGTRHSESIGRAVGSDLLHRTRNYECWVRMLEK
jgi:hypothetical protein